MSTTTFSAVSVSAWVGGDSKIDWAHIVRASRFRLPIAMGEV